MMVISVFITYWTPWAQVNGATNSVNGVAVEVPRVPTMRLVEEARPRGRWADGDITTNSRRFLG